MTLVIGMDEAGYGPNLGPLAIGLSAWRVAGIYQSEPRPSGSAPERATNIDLYKLLARLVTDKPDGKRLAIADSKVLYKPGGGVALLEQGVLSMLVACSETVPTCYDTLVDVLAADAEGARNTLPWHQNGSNPAVPTSCGADDLAAARARLSSESANARLSALRGRLVFPAEFNDVCGEYGSKGLALSHWTLALLTETLDRLALAPNPLPRAAIHVTCDKHGGRNNYAGLLSDHFPGHRLRVIVESRPRSAYLLEYGDTPITIEFRIKGESQLEAALASMVAKYLRELSMHAFNGYWQSHVPNLKPTAGYPVDARRFKQDIEAKQHELGIDDRLLWRER